MRRLGLQRKLRALLLPEGLLRQATVGEKLLGAGELAEDEDDGSQ